MLLKLKKSANWIAFVVLTLIIFLPSISVSSDLYKWIDKNGRFHFTDNYLNIPLEYRDHVEIRKMLKPEMEEMTKEPLLEKTKPAVKAKEKPVLNGKMIYKEECSKCHSLEGANPDKNATQLRGLLHKKSFKEHTLPVTEENIIKIILKGGWDNMPGFPGLEGEGIEKLMEYLLPYLEKKEEKKEKKQ